MIRWVLLVVVAGSSAGAQTRPAPEDFKPSAAYELLERPPSWQAPLACSAATICRSITWKVWRSAVESRA